MYCSLLIIVCFSFDVGYSFQRYSKYLGLLTLGSLPQPSLSVWPLTALRINSQMQQVSCEPESLLHSLALTKKQ